MAKPDPTQPKPGKPEPEPQGGFIRPAREDGTDLATDEKDPAPTS